MIAGQGLSGTAPEPIRQAAAEEACHHREHERRIMCQSLALWENARVGSEPAPALRAIDLTHPRLAAHFYVVDVADDPYRFATSTVSHCGGSLGDFCGRPVVGATLWDVLPCPVREEMTEFLKAAVRLGKPMAESGGFLCADGGEILFRDAVMPLRPEDGRRRLLGAISFRRLPPGTTGRPPQTEAP